MAFVVNIWDISLWLALTAVILLVTSELLYALPDVLGRLNVDRSRLRFAALGCGIAFLATVVMHSLEFF